jgi:hypothetical protein
MAAGRTGTLAIRATGWAPVSRDARVATRPARGGAVATGRTPRVAIRAAAGSSVAGARAGNITAWPLAAAGATAGHRRRLLAASLRVDP